MKHSHTHVAPYGPVLVGSATSAPVGSHDHLVALAKADGNDWPENALGGRSAVG